MALLLVKDIPEESYLELRMKLSEREWWYWFGVVDYALIGFVPFQHNGYFPGRGITIGEKTYAMMRQSYANGYFICIGEFAPLYFLKEAEIFGLEKGTHQVRIGFDKKICIERIV